MCFVVCSGHHGYMTAPAQDLVNPIHVVSELRISEVCCVGLSVQTTLSVKNTSTRWQQVLISVASATLDGRELDTSRPVPFIMKEKIFMEPNSQEDVQVILINHKSGEEDYGISLDYLLFFALYTFIPCRVLMCLLGVTTYFLTYISEPKYLKRPGSGV